MKPFHIKVDQKYNLERSGWSTRRQCYSTFERERSVAKSSLSRNKRELGKSAVVYIRMAAAGILSFRNIIGAILAHVCCHLSRGLLRFVTYCRNDVYSARSPLTIHTQTTPNVNIYYTYEMRYIYTRKKMRGPKKRYKFKLKSAILNYSRPPFC